MAIELELQIKNLKLSTVENDDKLVWIRREIKRPPGDYFTYEEVFEFFGMSPVELVRNLRWLRPHIEIYSDTLSPESSEERELFYNAETPPIECVHLLSDAKFHFSEVRRFREELIFSEMEHYGEGGINEYLGDEWGALDQVDEAYRDAYAARIAELDKECETLKEQLDIRESIVAELKEQLTVAESKITFKCNGKGMLLTVCEMRRNGYSEKEIAEILWNNEEGCSNPQIGALLHSNSKIDKLVSDTMTKYAQRLRGKAKRKA